MQRQRGELVPIGDALADLGGPVKMIREASPQARHHFTRADQVNQLVSASEADADLGFMARMMALCCLPRTNPGNQYQYKRVNGPYKLVMIAGADCKLPFGNLPRVVSGHAGGFPVPGQHDFRGTRAPDRQLGREPDPATVAPSRAPRCRRRGRRR